MHSMFGYVHAQLLQLRDARGQGTVEYVALILLVALVFAGVIAAMKGFKTDQGNDLGQVILSKIKDAVAHVQF
ncbi:MAG: Flp family type IVb pilin [Thermoleophilaceae bacterium]